MMDVGGEVRDWDEDVEENTYCHRYVLLITCQSDDSDLYDECWIRLVRRERKGKLAKTLI
jgi:hypothetical protein